MAGKSSSGATHAFGLFLLRLMVGWVFLSEGVQKFLYPAALGAGRFAKIGIPMPHFSAPIVGAFEIVCGAMLILGIATRYAIVPLLVVIGVAIATTKFPLLRHEGFWSAMHESRADLCMLLGLIAIACLGAGAFSVERR